MLLEWVKVWCVVMQRLLADGAPCSPVRIWAASQVLVDAGAPHDVRSVALREVGALQFSDISLWRGDIER